MDGNGNYPDLEAIDKFPERRKDNPFEQEGESNEVEAAVDASPLESSRLLSTMGHEIRNPINSIMGMTSILLQDETLTSDQREFVENIKVSGDALMEILNDILDFSNLECSKLTLNMEPFDLQSLVDETLSLITLDAARKGLLLSHRFNGAVPDFVIQDKARLRQILFSLLDSAVKRTDSGEIRLNISCQVVQSVQEIHFSVQDTGLGMSRDAIEDLFIPFKDRDPLIALRSRGSGLGLAVCKGLVKLMEGRIWVESAENIGSTFHFTIKTNFKPKIRKLYRDT